MARQVNGTGKDNSGDITRLCGAGFVTSKQDAIAETLSAGNGHGGKATPYFVSVDGATVNVRVYDRTVGAGTVQYLRSDADHTTANNLDELPDC